MNSVANKIATVSAGLLPAEKVKFASACEKNGLRRSEVIRALVSGYIDGDFTVTITQNVQVKVNK